MTAAGTWSAPGRVNLIGEHTDYTDGFVLPIAIGLRTRVTMSVRADKDVHATSRQGMSPLAYVAAAVRAVREHGVNVPGLDVVVDSDVPVGAGLSSSAALTCATALAAAELAGADLSPVTVAQLAQRAENEFVGVPCGLLDQMAATCAEAGHALFLDVRTLHVEQVPFRPAEFGLALLVIDTGVRHELADSAYGDRRRTVEEAAHALGVPALRDLTVADLPLAQERLRSDASWRRVRHVVTENQRVLDIVDLLRAGRMARIGPILSASHLSLKDDYEVSHPALDTVVMASLAAGALGARMTGGGFGGSAIALVPIDAVAAVTSEVLAAAHDAGQPTPEVITVEAGAGARRDC
jgi:galactokinase